MGEGVKCKILNCAHFVTRLIEVESLQNYKTVDLFISMQETKHTRNMFLTRALERILADKELRRSQNAQLKKACQSAIGELPVLV